MFCIKLYPSGDAALSVGDSVIQFFRDPAALNRYRDIALGRDGITDRGSILEFKYTGAILSLPADPSFLKQ
jgi:hypothetical protein